MRPSQAMRWARFSATHGAAEFFGVLLADEGRDAIANPEDGVPMGDDDAIVPVD